MDWELILENALTAAVGQNAVIYALAAIGLNMHFGYTGLLNFGQVAFVAAGAYGLAIGVASFELLLLMFAGITLGGLGTAYGALVGSFIVGWFVNVSTLWIAPDLKNIGALLVLILILLVRPQGIFGTAERVG